MARLQKNMFGRWSKLHTLVSKPILICFNYEVLIEFIMEIFTKNYWS